MKKYIVKQKILDTNLFYEFWTDFQSKQNQNTNSSEGALAGAFEGDYLMV